MDEYLWMNVCDLWMDDLSSFITAHSHPCCLIVLCVVSTKSTKLWMSDVGLTLKIYFYNLMLL